MKRYPFIAAVLGITVVSTAAYANYDKAVATINNYRHTETTDIHKPADEQAAAGSRHELSGRSGTQPAGQAAAGKSASAQTGTVQPGTAQDDAGQPAQANQQPQLKQNAQVNVPAQSQLPELYNGCEMTSLSMLMQAAGYPVDKLTLADSIKKDPTPLVLGDDGDPVSWGDPNRGFVGDISGDDMGFAVYHGPVAQLVNQLLPSGADDLSGRGFDQVLAAIADGRPSVVWTTMHFSPPGEWVSWQGPNGKVRVTFEEHAVLLTGYDSTNVYINDPFDGAKSKAINRKTFEASWKALGSQAVTFKK